MSSSSMKLLCELLGETPKQRAWRFRVSYGLERATVLAELDATRAGHTPAQDKYYREVLDEAWLLLRDELAQLDSELTSEAIDALYERDTLYDLRKEYDEEKKQAHYRLLNPVQLVLI